MSQKPKYYLIYQDLVKMINEGKLEVGSFLPTEKELQDYYSVSRTTVREAVKIMENDGLVTKRHGLGIVIESSKKYLDSSKLSSFHEGHKFHDLESRLCDYQEINSNENIRYKLGLPQNAPVIYHSKIRVVDGKTVGYQKVYIPKNYVEINKEILIQDKFSFYSYLEKNDIYVDRAIEIIEAIPATNDIAEFLGVKTGYPILYLDRITYDKRGRIVEYAQIYYLSEFYRYKVELNRVNN